MQNIYSYVCLIFMINFEGDGGRIEGKEGLFKSFKFSCCEAGVIGEDAVLHQIHNTLLDKMIHTHGNEFIQNRRMMANRYWQNNRCSCYVKRYFESISSSINISIF